MNPTTSRPKKSPSSKAQPKTDSGGVRSTSRSASKRRTAALSSVRARVNPRAAAGRADTAAVYRREFRAWQASLPTQLERDTLLWPEVLAESVVQEVERFLNADLPEDFAERLAAKTYRLYSRNKHFHKGLNRPGNGGRESLLMFMRHWTAGWLRRERYALYKKLPGSFGMGQRLCVAIKRRPPFPQAARVFCIQFYTGVGVGGSSSRLPVSLASRQKTKTVQLEQS